MNKKFISKATALSLAAISSISVMSISASADISYSATDSTISGTAVLATSVVTYKTTTHTAIVTTNATTGKKSVTFSSQEGYSVTEAAGDLEYGTGNNVDVTRLSTYFVSTAAANSTLNNIKNACTWTNANGANGTNALAAWKATWTTYVTAFNKNIDDSVTVVPSEPTSLTFGQLTYTQTPSSSTVTMAALKQAFTATTVAISDSTGEITTGSDWTINTTGSSTTTDSTTTYNTWYPVLATYRVPTTTGYSYQGDNNYWYTSVAAANLYGNGYSGTSKVTNYSSYSTYTTVYFCAVDGLYYTTAPSTSYIYTVTDTTYYSTSYGSYKAANGLYYPTIAAAQNASYSYNGTTTYYTYATYASNRYFSYYTGLCYSTASAASAASGSYGYVDLSTYTSSSSTNVLDPYYYYYYGGLGYGSTSSTIDPSDPTIYGSTKRSGWTKITSTIKSSASGSTVKIDMNEATSIPATVLAAAKSYGVNLKVVLANGATWTIKADDISSTSTALDVSVAYNVSVVKSSLVSAAKKANSNVKSSAQIFIGTNGQTINNTVTVKLSTKRAGCTAKLYRYTEKGSLALVDTAKVQSTGAASFDVTKGGAYVIIIKD